MRSSLNEENEEKFSSVEGDNVQFMIPRITAFLRLSSSQIEFHKTYLVKVGSEGGRGIAFVWNVKY